MSRPVKFCVRIHQGGYSYEQLREIAIAADQLGYDSLSLYDLINAPTLECWTTLTALAAQTENIRLVPLVLANLYRNPVLLANMAATLDIISNGRLVFGIGAGGDEGDHFMAGLAYPSPRQRIEMMEESVHIIRSLWSGERVTFQGNHYQIDGALCDPLPIQKPHPPILIGGRGEQYLLKSVARFADINNMGFNMSLDEHYRRRGIIKAHCESVGRDPNEIETSQNTNVYIAKDEAALDDLLARKAKGTDRGSDAYRASLGNAIVGTPNECVEQFGKYIDAGVSYFFLLFPEPVDTEDLRLFAEQVIPKLTG